MKLTLQDLDLSGKKVLLRVVFDVPLDKEGHITDDTRIRESLASIEYLLKQGASIILLSHLGRPKGVDPRLSLAPCGKRLSELLGKPVIQANDCVGAHVEALAKQLKKGEILLLENLRFHKEEENGAEKFAKQLSCLGDLYVNDAFAAAHRAHASTALIAHSFPGKAAMGFLMQKELSALESLLLHPKRPFYAIIGGAKISSKIGVLQMLSEKVDALFIGGAMAYPFLKLQGFSIGNSLCEEEQLPSAAQFLEHCHKKKLPLHLPEDLIVANAFSNEAKIEEVSVEQGVPEGFEGMDIGHKTRTHWERAFAPANTFFWNGPLGVFELPRFAEGTKAIARSLAFSGKISVVGGGDSLAAVNQLGLASHFTHVSTGGGACLEWIERGHLPGIDALSDKL
jgi:phosphoglycerate kinase